MKIIKQGYQGGRLGRWIAIVAFLLITSQSGYGRPAHLTAWQGIYPTSASDNVIGCAICHSSTSGGNPWNAYGWSIRLAFQAAGSSNITAAIQSVEGEDADGEGNSNLVEIAAGTQPGWRAGNNNTLFDKNGSVNMGNPPVAGATNLDPISFTLSWATPVNGSITGASNGQSFASGQVANLTAVPASGFAFAGWTGDVPPGDVTNNPLELTMDSAKNVVATFAPIIFYTLSWPAPTNGSITGASNGQSFASGQVANLTAVPASGFAFAGWTGDVPPGDVTNNPLELTMDSAKTVVATFAPIIFYTLSWPAPTNGSITGASNGQSFASGQVANLTAVPASGFAFAGWTGDVPPGDVTNNPLELTMDSAKTVVANFYRDTGGVLAYSEALSGDLSGDWTSPTPVPLVLGANAVTAQMGANGGTGATNGSDADYFVVVVPTGRRLTSITVDSYTFSPGDPGKSFGAYVAAAVFTGQQTGDIDGQVLFDATSGEIRDDLAVAPLGPGTYAFWFQETSANVVDYQLTLTLQDLNADSNGNGFTDFQEEELAAIQSTPRQVGDQVSIDLGGILGLGTYRVTGLPRGLSVGANGLISGTILAELGGTPGLLSVNGKVISFNLAIIPFQLAGSYEVLIENSNGLPVGRSKLTITGPGRFSATLQLQGERLRSTRGTATTTPIFADFEGTTLEFNVSTATDLVTGSQGTNTLRGFRLARPGRSPVQPVTVMFANDVPGDRTTTPGGTGYASGSLRPNGRLALRGLLGDARPFTASLCLSQTNQAVVFVQPYGDKTGSFFGGILTIGALGQPDRGGSTDSQTAGLQWRKLAISADKGYPLGFGIDTPLGVTGSVSKWISVPTAEGLALSLGLDLRQLHVSYLTPTADILPSLLSLRNTLALVRLGPSNSVPFSGSANRRTGTFSGRLTLPSPATRTSVSGVLLQDALFGTQVGAGLIKIPIGGGNFQTAGIRLDQ